MNAYQVLNDFALVALAAAQPLVIYMIARVLKRLDILTDRVNIQNGRVGKLESWREDHSRWSEIESGRLERQFEIAIAAMPKPPIGHDR